MKILPKEYAFNRIDLRKIEFNPSQLVPCKSISFQQRIQFALVTGHF